MESPAKLSLEQEFRLQVLSEQVRALDANEAQEYIVELIRQMMVKDNLVKHLMKEGV